MKKALTILGTVFVSLLLLGIFGFFVLDHFGKRFDRESQAYVDQSIPVIVASWDSKELLDRASPELLQVATEEKMEALFHLFSDRLGTLKEYKESKGQATIFSRQQGLIVTADYTADAVFEKSPAVIQVQIVRRNNVWRILKFYVNSEALHSEPSH